MSMLANRQNNSALMSESDHDDDLDQNLSTNQQNESMMHKVKDVVSKFLHPSFLFSSGDASRSKRKRTTSIENESEEKVETDGQTTTNGYEKITKISISRSSRKDDEAELTDDEIIVAPTGPSFTKDLSDPEQQKKRRRTANYHQTITTTTVTATTASSNSDSNGFHSNERITPLTNTTNNTSFSSTRRLLDFESTSEKNHVQRSKEINETDDQPPASPAKQRFNIASSNRSFASNYDPSQSPLFSVGNRKPTDTTTTPSRTTTNLKSNNNDFSGNFLLASSLIQRAQTNPIAQPNQSISTLSNPNQNGTQRPSATERQMLGVTYSSINSRRLPYIERLRRRTLQDCIRLNRTLDSEPLSISTIEEHTSAANTPRRNQTKTLEKDCAVQCDISTMDSFVEPTRKMQRTFPPPDIREEALSIPTASKTANLSQMDCSSLQTQSSIVIETFKTNNQDNNKPKVLGDVTPFSWPKFARAQDEFSKKYPDKCRADIITAPTMKTIFNTATNGSNSASNISSTSGSIVKIPILSASPPRVPKPSSKEIWKCPNCETEKSAQVSSCSICYAINPNYERSSVIEPTSTAQITIGSIQTISEDVTTAAPKLPSLTTTSASATTTFTSSIITTPGTFTTSSVPISITTDSWSTSVANSPLKTNTTSSTMFSGFGATTSTATPITASQASNTSLSTTNIRTTSTFTMPTATSSAPTSTFNVGTSSTPSMSMFGSFTPLSSTTTTTTTSASATTPISFMPTMTTASTTSSSTFPGLGTFTAPGTLATTTATSINPISSFSSASTPFSSFTNPSATSTVTATSSSTSSDGMPKTTFGGSSFTSSLSSSTLPTSSTTSSTSLSTIPLSTGTATSGTSSSVPSNLFGIGANATTSAPAPSSIGNFSFGNTSSFGSTATGTTTSNASATNNPSAVGNILGTSSSATLSTPSLFGSSLTSNPTSSSAPNLFNTGSSVSSAGSVFQASSAAPSSTTTSAGLFTFGSSAPQTFTSPVISASTPSTTPSFGSNSIFGSSTAAQAPGFSTFGMSNTSAPFMFGGSSSLTTTNPASSTSGTTGTTGGFPFPSATPTTSSTSSIGSTGISFSGTPSFNFSTTPTMNFGSISSTGTGGNPFSAGATPFGLSNTSFGLSDPNQVQENNPFNAGSDNSGRRPIAKAKRRAGRN